MAAKYDFSKENFWKKGKIIGTGGSSTVFEATIQHNNEIIAAKEIQIDGLTKDQVLAIEAEVNTIKSLEHNHIVNYLGTQLRDHFFYIFLEHADRGSLRQYYRKHGKLSESQVVCCTKQLLLGLLYLHGNDIAHRDIKGANVLLTHAGELKLADFGASKRYDTASIVSGLKGTPQWMAPEVIKGTQITSGWMKADVWSLGCTVVEMLTGTLPYAEFENPMTAMYHIASGKTPPLDPKTVSSYATDFVETCCNVDPDKRPSVKQLLQHPFVKDIDPELRIVLQEDDEESDNLIKTPPGSAKDMMSSTEMRVILTSDMGDLHQSPDNSPPPSPPKDLPDSNNEVNSHEISTVQDSKNKEETPLDDETAEKVTAASSGQPVAMTIKNRPPALHNTIANEEASALQVLELQKTPNMYTSNRKKGKAARKTPLYRRENTGNKNEKKEPIEVKQANVDKKEVASKTVAVVPFPPSDSSKSHSSTTFVRRSNSKEDTTKSTDRKVEATLDTSETTSQIDTMQKVDVVNEKKTENKPITPPAPVDTSEGNVVRASKEDMAIPTKQSSGSDSRAESTDELSPVNQINNLPAETLRYKRERQTSTDSSGMDEEIKHQHPPANNLKRNKKGMSKSFSVKSDQMKLKEENENGTKPLSLAKHLSKKLNLSVKSNHGDSDGGSSSGYCASNGSDSGSDYEYIDDVHEDMSMGKEEKKINANVTRDETNTAPSYHDQSNSAGLDDNMTIKQKKSKSKKNNKSFQDESSDDGVTEHSRPVAPFTSEKLFLHNNLGADNFSRAGQIGAAAVRKEAAMVLNSNHSNRHGHSNFMHSSSKYGGYHAASKGTLNHNKKQSKRSKSANVGQTGSSKLVLPSLQSSGVIRNGTAGAPSVVIPQLALRAIQSAPTVTRSLNLPPLLKSKTPSNKDSKSKSNVFSYQSEPLGAVGGGFVNVSGGAAGGGGEDSFQQSIKFISDAAEQEGGILAPRKE